MKPVFCHCLGPLKRPTRLRLLGILYLEGFPHFISDMRLRSTEDENENGNGNGISANTFSHLHADDKARDEGILFLDADTQIQDRH
ncbi:10806_t:CDS:2 [Acaulospora colombiana]|uniref:10806_t:CDS:1 n=1 Tax=Acaulospora colombiana TaxID=27376 RepID=A0ACA9KUY8_9GLOM|nr:10806_t:CDS:2 [Acaulospora colombiana]